MAKRIWESSNWASTPHSSNTTTASFLTSTWNATSLTECNHQPYDGFSYTVRVLLMMPVLIFGFAANAMNVIIFRQKRMRTSMVNWYLVALAVTDVGVLFSSFCMLSLPVICEDFDSLMLFNLGVSAQRWTYALGLTMQTASVGMTVLVSAHRFLGVVFPFRAQQWCTVKRVKAAMWSVAIFSVGFNISRWFEIDVDACHSTVYNATAIRLVLSDLRRDNLYYSAYMVILYTLFMFALPFILLIIMNAFIVTTVHRSYRMRQTLTNTVSNTVTTNSLPGSIRASERRKPSQASKPPPATAQRQQRQYGTAQATVGDSAAGSGSPSTTSNAKENKTTIMLIAVVLMFLICNSLAFINNILEILTAHGVPIMDAYLTSVEVSNFLVVVNSASNIFIYWTFSARYRLLFRRCVAYFCCCLSPLASMCAAGSQRREYQAANNAPTLVRDGHSAPNRLLMRRKNNRCDDVSRRSVVPHAPRVVRLRQNDFENRHVETASITRHDSAPLCETKLEPKPERWPSRPRRARRRESQPQEDPLLKTTTNSESESKRASIIAYV